MKQSMKTILAAGMALSLGTTAKAACTSCAELGYTQAESSCSGEVIRCPFDTSKVICRESGSKRERKHIYLLEENIGGLLKLHRVFMYSDDEGLALTNSYSVKSGTSTWNNTVYVDKTFSGDITIYPLLFDGRTRFGSRTSGVSGFMDYYCLGSGRVAGIDGTCIGNIDYLMIVDPREYPWEEGGASYDAHVARFDLHKRNVTQPSDLCGKVFQAQMVDYEVVCPKSLDEFSIPVKMCQYYGFTLTRCSQNLPSITCPGHPEYKICYGSNSYYFRPLECSAYNEKGLCTSCFSGTRLEDGVCLVVETTDCTEDDFNFNTLEHNCICPRGYTADNQVDSECSSYDSPWWPSTGCMTNKCWKYAN